MDLTLLSCARFKAWLERLNEMLKMNLLEYMFVSPVWHTLLLEMLNLRNTIFLSH